MIYVPATSLKGLPIGISVRVVGYLEIKGTKYYLRTLNGELIELRIYGGLKAKAGDFVEVFGSVTPYALIVSEILEADERLAKRYEEVSRRELTLLNRLS